MPPPLRLTRRFLFEAMPAEENTAKGVTPGRAEIASACISRISAVNEMNAGGVAFYACSIATSASSECDVMRRRACTTGSRDVGAGQIYR